MTKKKYPVPEHLSERSRALWNEITGKRAKSPGRLALLRSALEALDRADQASDLIAREGLIFTTETTKTKHVHPATRIEKDCRTQFMRAWAQLGLEWDYEVDGR